VSECVVLPGNQILVNNQSTDILRLSYKKRSCQNLWYLAKTKGQSISIPITYTVFLAKMQKRQTRWNGFAHFEKTISQVFEASDIYMFIAIGNARSW